MHSNLPFRTKDESLSLLSLLPLFCPLDFFRANESVSSEALEKPCLVLRYIWDLQRLVNDGFKQFHPVRVPKRRKPGDHFVDNTSKAPPVNSFVMTLLPDNFRSEVLRSTTDRHSFFILVSQCLGQTKVCEFYVPSFIE